MSNQEAKRTEERTETHACDYISRQAAIEAIGKNLHKGTDLLTDTFVAGIEQVLEALPSAQQGQRWIPVSERLPEYDGEKYFVTYYAETIGRTRLGISYCYANREGFWSDIPLGYKVIAWMPLPEPYKGEEE